MLKPMANLQERINRLPLSPGIISGLCGIFSFAIRIPFLFRWDLHFGGDSGTAYLMAQHILNGDRPLYHYGQDYNVALEAYASAGLFKLFGPSIPLAASFCLFEWCVAVSLGVYLLIRGTDKFHGLAGGLLAVVGVPYTLHYIVAPIVGHPLGVLAGMAILFQTFYLMKTGPSAFGLFLWGFMVGAGYFLQKLCVPNIIASILALFLIQTASWNLRQMKRPFKLALMVLTGVLLGYAPEPLYKLHHPGSDHLTGIASPWWILKNGYNVLRSIPAYFDGQPISRIPEAVYFFIQRVHITPDGPLDFGFSLLGLGVVIFAFQGLRKSLQEKNVPLFLLSSLIFINMALVVISLQSGGEFLNARRYLYPSAIPLSLWTGYFLASARPRNFKWLPFGALFLGILFVSRVAYHEIILFKSPDELREIRWVISGLKDAGINRGLAHWGHAYIIDALTDEKIIVAGRDGSRFPEYDQWVTQADHIALIDLKADPIEKRLSFMGSTFVAEGPPRENETFRWIPYMRIP